MSEKEYVKEDFDEDCPRFIPMKYNESIDWYIFDTEELSFLGFITPYYDVKDCDNVCNIINTLDYMLKR